MAAGSPATFQVIVSGLPASASEDSLRTTFSVYGAIHDLRLSSGQARISFTDRHSAEQAVAAMHHKVLEGSEIAVVAELRKDEACVHIRELPTEASEAVIREALARFGTIASVQIETGNKGVNYGYVQFDSAESASRAVAAGTIEVLKSQIRLERFIPKTERKAPTASVYVRGFDVAYTEQQLKAAFADCGDITSCTINRDPQGSRVYGFVNFASKDSADRALELSGVTRDGITWYVSPAASHTHAPHSMRGHNEEWAKRNVYISGFPAHLTEANIRQLCESFGEIESIRMQPKVVLGYGEVEQSSAFVCFKREQDADAAIESLRHTLIERCRVKASKWKPIESRRTAGVSPALLAQWPFSMPFGYYPPMMPQRMERPAHLHHAKRPHPHKPQPHPQPQSQPTLTQFDMEKFNSLNAGDKRRMIGEYIFFLLSATYKETTGKITGMLLEVPQQELIPMLSSPQSILDKAAEAMEVLRKHRAGK